MDTNHSWTTGPPPPPPNFNLRLLLPLKTVYRIAASSFSPKYPTFPTINIPRRALLRRTIIRLTCFTNGVCDFPSITFEKRAKIIAFIFFR